MPKCTKNHLILHFEFTLLNLSSLLHIKQLDILVVNNMRLNIQKGGWLVFVCTHYILCPYQVRLIGSCIDVCFCLYIPIMREVRCWMLMWSVVLCSIFCNIIKIKKNESVTAFFLLFVLSNLRY